MHASSTPDASPARRPLWERCRCHVTPWRAALLVMLCIEIIWVVCPPPQSFVERCYSQKVYPLFSRIVVAVQNVFPVPVTALVVTAFGTAFLVWAWRRGRALRADGKSRWQLIPLAAWMAAQGVIVFLFWSLAVWGVGYQRLPVVSRWALDNANLSTEESVRLQAELLSIVRANIDNAQSQSRDAAVSSIARTMQRLVQAQGDGAVYVPSQVRATPPGLFLIFSTAGMCVPGAIEPFADGAFEDTAFVQVAAHELGHVAGYNRESEATLAGYLAGLAADNALARYAVALGMYMDIIGRIRDKDLRDAAWKALPERARQDVHRKQEIGDRYRIKIEIFQRARYRIYDSYLKSQGVKEGIVSYSTGLRLFAGAWRKGLANMAPEISTLG